MADRGGVKRKCRPRYDPKLAESVAKRRVEHDKVKMNFESKIREVCELAPQMLLQTEWHCLGNDKNSHALEIALVSALGLKNVILIEKAINLIPSNTPDRYGVALDSVQAQLSSSCMSRSHYLRYIQLISEVLDLTVQDTSSDDCHTGSPIQERYLCPPVDRCVHDGGALVPNHSSTIVTVFTLTGPEVAKKYTLRCVACQCIYSYSMFGNKFKDGQVYYEKTRKLIEISDTVYCERSLYEMFCSLSLHSWVSFSGFSEAYFECCQGFNKQKAFLTYWADRKGSIAEIPQLTRKMVSSMFYSGELEKEIRDPNCTHRMSWSFTYNSDKDECIRKIVDEHSDRVYDHKQTSACLTAGCGRCWAMDGNWKLCFPHCMYPVTAHLPNLPALHFPNVCPHQLKSKSAFCIEHHSKAESLKYPTDVKGFLKFCGASKTASVQSSTELPYEVVECEEGGVMTSKLAAIVGESKDTSNDVMMSQGVAKFVSKYPSVINSCIPSSVNTATSCRKDLGDKGKLRLWSRGHIFIVRTCGHIDMWRPIFRSESPSQAFLIVISWLYEVLQNIPEHEWRDVVLFYDNMCHLDSLRAATDELPLPPPYNNMWKKITKVIDRLHIRNHTDKSCLEKYNPNKVPQCNSMVAEQTFTWLSRYKRILCSMDKLHHMFFLHRIVRRRNHYNELCLANERKPLLPKVKSLLQ